MFVQIEGLSVTNGFDFVVLSVKVCYLHFLYKKCPNFSIKESIDSSFDSIDTNPGYKERVGTEAKEPFVQKLIK